MICQDRSRLVREYADAANGYAARVREMADFVISGQEVRINEARRICRAAWDLVEKTRVALYRHEADHCCDRKLKELKAENPL